MTWQQFIVGTFFTNIFDFMGITVYTQCHSDEVMHVWDEHRQELIHVICEVTKDIHLL